MTDSENSSGIIKEYPVDTDNIFVSVWNGILDTIKFRRGVQVILDKEALEAHYGNGFNRIASTYGGKTGVVVKGNWGYSVIKIDGGVQRDGKIDTTPRPWNHRHLRRI